MLQPAAEPVVPDPRLRPLPGAEGRGVASLPDHAIYRPAKLDAICPKQMGLYLFGNGACSDDGASSRMHLLEIASCTARWRLRSPHPHRPGVTQPMELPGPRQTDARPAHLPAATHQPQRFDGPWTGRWPRTPTQEPYFGKPTQRHRRLGLQLRRIQALRVAPDPASRP